MKVTQVSLWQQLRSLSLVRKRGMQHCGNHRQTRSNLWVLHGEESVAYAAGARSVNCQRVTQRAN